MMGKVYSVFLCVLLISVLFFPLTSAGRVLLDKPQKDDKSGEHSKGGSKIDVGGSRSNTAPSAIGNSSPFRATPSNSNKPAANARPNNRNSAKTLSCGKGTAYSSCLPSYTRSRSCSKGFVRNCIKNC